MFQEGIGVSHPRLFAQCISDSKGGHRIVGLDNVSLRDSGNRSNGVS